jgi:hypothetical protein
MSPRDFALIGCFHVPTEIVVSPVRVQVSPSDEGPSIRALLLFAASVVHDVLEPRFRLSWLAAVAQDKTGEPGGAGRWHGHDALHKVPAETIIYRTIAPVR